MPYIQIGRVAKRKEAAGWQPLAIEPNDLVVYRVHKRLQLARTRGMTQLAQRLRLDLADALTGDLEALAHFFECVLGAVFKTEAHLDHAFFARSERAQNLRGVLLQVDADHGIGGGDGLA